MTRTEGERKWRGGVAGGNEEALETNESNFLGRRDSYFPLCVRARETPRRGLAHVTVR